MMSAIRARVSIVIPCYNRHRYLSDAIKSAVSGDFTTEIRGHLHARTPWPALRKGLTLAHLAPHVFRRELVKKTRLTAQPRLGSGL